MRNHTDEMNCLPIICSICSATVIMFRFDDAIDTLFSMTFALKEICFLMISNARASMLPRMGETER